MTSTKETSIDIKVMNRWIVVVGAIMIQVALGAIYAWSAFTTPLQSSAFDFNKTMTQAIFSTGLATFGIFTIIGGRLQKRFGPMKIALLGGVLLGIGYLLGGFVGDNFPLKLLGIGFIGGAGIGLAYVVPIGVGIKWFPDKKGQV
jgi:OFA family oxalate/formate antiporter-like MFS transporter